MYNEHFNSVRTCLKQHDQVSNVDCTLSTVLKPPGMVLAFLPLVELQEEWVWGGGGGGGSLVEWHLFHTP